MNDTAFGSSINSNGDTTGAVPHNLGQATSDRNRPPSVGNSGNMTPLQQKAHIQQQQQQQQRLLMQQKLRQQQQQQQQAMQNYENQFYQFLMTVNKKPKRLYNFAEDPDAILKKYEQFRPSFEFHIYENNYKICAPANTRVQQQQRTPQATSDGLILNKNNSTLKEFLEYVARGCIPEAIMEVLKDCNIQFYEGNLILQVYDHTNTVDVKQTQKKTPEPTPTNGAGVQNPTVTSSSAPTSESTGATPTASNQGVRPDLHGQPSSRPVDNVNDVAATSGSLKKAPSNGETIGSASEFGESGDAKSAKEIVATFKRPRVYRTLLRPNGLTHYYDMLSYADHTRFSDNIYQQLESEILTLTKRNLDLDVPLNPYEHREKLDDVDFLPFDKQLHRELSTRKGTKGQVGHIDLHEESPQHSSSYEQMMLIMSERTSTTTMSTIAASLAKGAADLTNSSLKNSGGKNSPTTSSTPGRGNTSNSVAAAAVAAAAAVGSSSNDNNQFSRLKFVEQWRANKEKRKQQAMNANIAPASYNQRISMSAPLSAQQIKQQQQSLEQQKANAKGPVDDDKAKVKKPRKTVKKSTPAATTDSSKKKKTAKTKK
ncbi:LADA_0D00188g1_1 [Lachancea dasiensis]|uniref:LADA_0D00188g1_1 n=1 Tax=Lachancea dasiensis TaxID=1072105 RepID=A0A1G4J3W8_9SACH|nr:LADA_0D00188g1_1 [Lachancea dasiensis]